jgi:lipoprotein-anchoring transpeptidase ErfK/SrfK
VWSVPNSDWAGELAGTTVAGGTAENPLRSRWMGVTDGVGFHGTSDVASLGSAASHGCIRMDVPDIEQLYDQVPVGTPVYIG